MSEKMTKLASLIRSDTRIIHKTFVNKILERHDDLNQSTAETIVRVAMLTSLVEIYEGAAGPKKVAEILYEIADTYAIRAGVTNPALKKWIQSKSQPNVAANPPKKRITIRVTKNVGNTASKKSE